MSDEMVRLGISSGFGTLGLIVGALTGDKELVKTSLKETQGSVQTIASGAGEKEASPAPAPAAPPQDGPAKRRTVVFTDIKKQV